jgi:hypothetical protein
MKLLLTVTAGVAVVAFAGCGIGERSARGFKLPDGNAANGKTAFTELKCYTCHIVPGATGIPAPGETIKAPVILGGEMAKVKTYSELVTSIIHPSHNLSPQLSKEWMGQAKLSPMGSFNRVMTVEQMIDLVAFLQPLYGHIQEQESYE